MSSTTTSAPDTEELAQFRQRWKEELRQRGQPHPQEQPQQPQLRASSTSHATVTLPESPEAPTRQLPIHTNTVARPQRLNNALETYVQAVFEEQKGNHPEATRLYRNAFRLDPNVDKAYHREELSRQRQQLQSLAIPLSKAFSGLSFEPRDAHNDHDTGMTPTAPNRSLDVLVESWPATLSFEPENEAKPVHPNKLPEELIIYILCGFTNNLDTMAIERFGAVCRKARVLTLDNSIWRRLVEFVLVSPQLEDPLVSLDEIAKKYQFNYRRMYMEQPHIRFDGVYIAICHYIRNGQGESPWAIISHLITYRRFLRFLPNGKVLSFRANEDQEITDVVHSLARTDLIRKDLCVGDWQLMGTEVIVTNLTEVLPDNDKYSFQMVLGLKSRPVGRWNKLDIIGYDSVNMETGDIIPFPLRHERPYWFSKVRSYRV